MHASHLAFFAKYIERHLGIVYSTSNYFLLESRLREILVHLNVKDISALQTIFEVGPPDAFKQFLLDSATNNETSFFRDTKIFAALRDYMLPRMLAEQKRHLRIWSAAASSGQEAYSLAITLQEALLASQSPKWTFEILATDICQRILERAKLAVFSQLEVQRGLPSQLLLKYFTQLQDGRWGLNSDVRSFVTTQILNLTEPFDHVGKFDIIFCRNVLIYQNVDRKKDILRRLRQRLHPGGFLVLGAGETILGLSNEFVQQEHGNAVVYQARVETGSLPLVQGLQ